MAKQREKAVVPRLRFPKFRGATPWRAFELSSIADVAKGVQLSSSLKDALAQYPHFNGGISCSSRTDKFNRDSNTIIISEGGNSCGYVQFVEEPFWCGGHCYSVEPKRGGEERYLFYVLQARQRNIMGLRVGSGLPNIPKNVLDSFEVAYAEDLAEQQKIADCLTSLDEVIAAQGRKVEALKAHKRGLMQQLFPREGETRPRLRFPEFRDAPEWTLDVLGNVCEVLNNRRVPISSDARRSGPFPYYGASGVVDFVEGYIFDEPLLLVGEDGAKWGAFERTAFVARGKYWVNNHAHVLRPIEVIDTLLENYLTMIDLGGYVSGHAPPKLTLAKLKTIEVVYPTSRQEQERIADCLSSLDAQISAESNQLAALKTHKQGLMQQLFPAPEAA